jgi:tetratricopeptide (TPR) repeat protein
LCLIAGWWPVTAAAQSSDDLFVLGNEAYKNKQYDQAIARYNDLLARGVVSANIYFNLGNAYFKAGDLGHAVLYYMRARKLDPGDEDINSNLEFARGFTRVQMEGVQLNPIRGFFESIVSPFSLSTLAWASSMLFIIVMALLAVRYGLGRRSSLVRSGITLGIVLLVLSSGLTTFKYNYTVLTKRAVLVGEAAPVYAGPSEEMEVELQGSPGLIVEVVDESGDWYNVLFENKRRGWIQKDLVAVV